MDDAAQSDSPAGIVTRIAALPRHPGQFAIDIDGRSALVVGEKTLLESGIQPGDMLDRARIEQLLAADEIARATEAALVYLAHRPRSEREVRDRLRRGKFTPAAIESVIARLHDWRYLDDTDFARRWVENRATHRPRGRRLLEQELRKKGIDPETVNDVIAEADLDELSAATELARRRVEASPAAEDRAVVRRRVSGYLARRGYTYDVIRTALERALGSEDEDELPLD